MIICVALSAEEKRKLIFTPKKKNGTKLELETMSE